MNRFRSVTLGVVFLTACAEQQIPVEPGALSRFGGMRFNSQAAGSDSYLVEFKGNKVPDNFEATVAALGGEVIFTHAGAGIGAVSGISEIGAAALATNSEIAGVVDDYYTVLDEPTDLTLESVAVDAPASPANPAAAFFFPRQWNMRAISANTAWAAGHLGKNTTRVGILDTGIDYTHADLTGLVDLADSRSFLSAAENARVTTAFPGAHLVADLNYHGTHVSATVASNGIAAAGVTSGVRLVGLKVCTPGTPANGFRGSCPNSGTFAAILYASDLGLDAINMSLGGAFFRRDGSAAGGFPPSFISIINRVFNYANNKGTVVVVAAGNAAMDMDHNGNIYNTYCNAPHVVCVSATGPTAQAGTNGPWTNVDALAGYSNFGRSGVTVAAPGGNNATAVWAGCSRFSLAFPVCATGTFVLGIQGTSMATPHVTGLAALIAGEVGHNAVQIRARIQKSADDLGDPGTDPAYGAGRINVARAAGL